MNVFKTIEGVDAERSVAAYQIADHLSVLLGGAEPKMYDPIDSSEEFQVPGTVTVEWLWVNDKAMLSFTAVFVPYHPTTHHLSVKYATVEEWNLSFNYQLKFMPEMVELAIKYFKQLSIGQHLPSASSEPSAVRKYEDVVGSLPSPVLVANLDTCIAEINRHLNDGHWLDTTRVGTPGSSKWTIRAEGILLDSEKAVILDLYTQKANWPRVEVLDFQEGLSFFTIFEFHQLERAHEGNEKPVRIKGIVANRPWSR